MAIAINASLSKKIPLPSHDFASQHVSVSILGEVIDLARVPEEAARLLALAEAAVDQKLGLVPGVALTTPPSTTPLSPSASQPQQRTGPSSSSPSSYPSSGGRRAPAAISGAQLRFLRQLCDRNPGAFDRIAADHQIGALEELPSRVASGIIDQLKGATR